MGSLDILHGRKTVVIVAYRLSTVRDCDRIYVVEGGAVVAQGRYQDLLETSPQFQALVSPGSL